MCSPLRYLFGIEERSPRDETESNRLRSGVLEAKTAASDMARTALMLEEAIKASCAEGGKG